MTKANEIMPQSPNFAPNYAKSIFASFYKPTRRTFDLSATAMMVAALLRGQHNKIASCGLSKDGTAQISFDAYMLVLTKLDDVEITWHLCGQTNEAHLETAKEILILVLQQAMTIFEPEAIRWSDEERLIDADTFRALIPPPTPRRIPRGHVAKTQQTPVHKPYGAPTPAPKAAVLNTLVEKRLRDLFVPEDDATAEEGALDATVDTLKHRAQTSFAIKPPERAVA